MIRSATPYSLVTVILLLLCLLMPTTTMFAQTTAGPEACFEELWRNFHEGYAIFEVKGVDWDVLYRVYRPQVTAETTEEELYDVLTSMLGHLNDNHVMLKATSLGRDFSAGYVGEFFAGRGLDEVMRFIARRPLPERYFQGEPQTCGEGVFQYGWVDDGIGYFHFGGFGNPEGSGMAVDHILASLSGMKALIIDVRFNSGGDDRVGKAIADRFADTKRLYMTTATRTGPGPEDFASPTYWHVEPAASTFTGPIILLTNRLSLSAAENFALAMRVLPHATQVGEFTSGCFADMRWLELPNGWRYSLSWNLFRDYAGRCWEGIGVPPDIMVRGEPVVEDPDRAFETALALLRAGGPALSDESASAAAVRSSLVEKLVADFQAGGLDVARDAFREAGHDLDGGRWYLSAVELNTLGYELLAGEMLSEAVAVFELYVEAFPLDANAWDSLGEGLMVNGERERAITNYERSLELDPQNTNAVQMLERLRQGE